LLIITNITRTFAQNNTRVITERRMKTNNNVETVFVFTQVWSLIILMDFNEIRYRVPTTDWKTWLGVCWKNTFDFYDKKLILTISSKHSVSYRQQSYYSSKAEASSTSS